MFDARRLMNRNNVQGEDKNIRQRWKKTLLLSRDQRSTHVSKSTKRGSILVPPNTIVPELSSFTLAVLRWQLHVS